MLLSTLTPTSSRFTMSTDQDTAIITAQVASLQIDSSDSKDTKEDTKDTKEETKDTKEETNVVKVDLKEKLVDNFRLAMAAYEIPEEVLDEAIEMLKFKIVIINDIPIFRVDKDDMNKTLKYLEKKKVEVVKREHFEYHAMKELTFTVKCDSDTVCEILLQDLLSRGIDKDIIAGCQEILKAPEGKSITNTDCIFDLMDPQITGGDPEIGMLGAACADYLFNLVPCNE